MRHELSIYCSPTTYQKNTKKIPKNCISKTAPLDCWGHFARPTEWFNKQLLGHFRISRVIKDRLDTSRAQTPISGIQKKHAGLLSVWLSKQRQPLIKERVSILIWYYFFFNLVLFFLGGSLIWYLFFFNLVFFLVLEGFKVKKLGFA